MYSQLQHTAGAAVRIIEVFPNIVVLLEVI